MTVPLTLRCSSPRAFQRSPTILAICVIFRPAQHTIIYTSGSLQLALVNILIADTEVRESSAYTGVMVNGLKTWVWRAAYPAAPS